MHLIQNYYYWGEGYPTILAYTILVRFPNPLALPRASESENLTSIAFVKVCVNYLEIGMGKRIMCRDHLFRFLGDCNANANANANANGKENYMQMSPFPMCTAIAMDRKSSCCPYWQSIQMYRLKFSATENEFINHFRNWTIISVSL